MTLAARVQLRRGDFDLDVDLSVAAGEVVALLGPNGSGKTSALHALAGLLPLDTGSISVAGTTLDDPAADIFVTPDRRPVSLVFQEYLLFPHLSALDNVAFGLAARGTPKPQARADARTWLTRLGVEDKSASRPRELSGGQAQRVALARALAPAPTLLLLDEPLAALDAGTRDAVRRDLRRHLVDFRGAAVLVTHDPLDALALATQVVVLDAGHVIQSGPIGELTTRPRSRYVADLVGLNLLEGTARQSTVELTSGARLAVADPAEGAVYALIHPHAVALHTSEPQGSPRNQWGATVEGFDLLGDRVRVRLAGEVPLTAEVTAGAISDLRLHEGQRVWAVVKATEISTYPR